MTTLSDQPAPAGRPLFRINDGALESEFVAALTAVLIARAAGADAASPEPEAAPAGWRRPERIDIYSSPLSWH